MFGRNAMAISEEGRADTRPIVDIGSATNVISRPPCSKSRKVENTLIVFGRDDKGKAHASYFSKDTREAAIKAAHLMGFVSLSTTKVVMRNIAEDLPEGRIFKSGKAFVPFVKEETCAVLEDHAKQFPSDVLKVKAAKEAAKSGKPAKASAENRTASSGVPSNKDGNPPTKSKSSEGPSDVKVGTIVLAVDDPDDGWWEAKVTHAHKSGIGTNTITMLTLKWVIEPDEPCFVRRANDVAYFPADYGQDAPQADSAEKAS